MDTTTPYNGEGLTSREPWSAMILIARSVGMCMGSILIRLTTCLLLALAMMLQASLPVLADPPDLTLKDRRGKATARIVYNKFLDRYDIKDPVTGKREGHVKRNDFLDRWEIKDRHGRKQGSIERNSFLDRWNVKDRHGKKKGSIERNSFLDRWDVKDRRGQKQGSMQQR